MTFYSYFRRELSRAFTTSVAVLVIVVLTMFLINILRQASLGKVNPAEIGLLLGFTTLGYLNIVIALGLFLAVTACLARMYRDNEMLVWISSGVGLLSFVRPLVRFCAPVWLLIAVLSLWVWPWSQYQIEALRDRYLKRNDLERVAPGMFQISANGNRVFFIDRNSGEGRPVRNIFIATQEPLRQIITSAQAGHLTDIDVHGERFLVLEFGQQLEMSKSDGSARLTAFERLETRINQAPRLVSTYRASTVPSAVLWQQNDRFAKAELSWRLGLIWTAINLSLLALACAQINPRNQFRGQLGLAILAFLIYFNLNSLGRNWVANGVMAWGEWLLALHAPISLLTLLLLATRLHHYRPWRGWASRSSP